MSGVAADLDRRLEQLTDRDRARLAARARRARTDADRAALERAVDAAERRIEDRRRALPAITYPEDLPVVGRRDELLAAIEAHQVVVVAGETGSGKTTQLPKMCLELGRGIRGTVAHTQPRRIAARAVAERLADELSVPLGGPVGYAVRFDDRVGPATLVKVLTDGLLLAEVQRDPDLLAYDTVIVDEAHERSLNIDFLLGYLTRLLPRRPDLKVVVTSATIDTARFADHFGAPVVEVSGRTYPVEVRYRPVADDADDRGRDINQAICDAVGELAAEGPGDVLVFLPGERDIRDAADALRHDGPPDIEVLPLYSRLSAAEQHRVFRPHRGRRVVLATNVAETSLTVPGIRSVVDTGTARISRYNHRTKVQRLPIEAVSRASADQRAGRCGRVAPGTCIRLYSEEDYLGRPEFTDPEVLRTNLASVILQMASIGLGPVADFPFLEPPDRRAVADGVAVLDELGALRHATPDGAPEGQAARPALAVGRDGGPRLTDLGRRLARLPLDPRLGRMVLEAQRLGSLREVTVIAAALSVQDPRERPTDAAAAAAEAHRRFEVPDSDLLGYLRLWDHVRERQAELSGGQFRRACRAEHLSVVRLRDWQDLVGQLHQLFRSEGVELPREPAAPAAIHQAVLAGLLSQIGARDRERGDYRAARGARFSISRDSALAGRQPAWVMAAELVDTGRVWARRAARIEPAWVERLGAHLLSRTTTDPWWDDERVQAMAEEHVSIFGLHLATHRVGWHRVDPAGARQLLMHHGLGEGRWPGAATATARTAERTAQIRGLEERARRRDLLAGPGALEAWWDAQVPAEVTTGRLLDRWWRQVRASRPEALEVPLEVLVDPGAGPLDVRAWPDELVDGDLRLPLGYRFAPGEDDDGITATVPVGAVDRLHPERLDWLVRGARPELVAALLRSLPRALRRALPPIAEVAPDLAGRLGPGAGPPPLAVAAAAARLVGAPVDPAWLDADALPAHLRLRYRVVDATGRQLGAGRDLAALRAALRAEIAAAVAAAAPGLSRHGESAWTWGDLPRRVEAPGGAVGWPAVVDEGPTVGVAVLQSAEAAAGAMWQGTRRLLLLEVPLPHAHLQRRLTNATKLALAAWSEPLGAVLEDCATAVVDDVLGAHGGPSWEADGHRALVEATRAVLADRVVAVATAAGGAVAAAAALQARVEQLAARHPGALAAAVDDLRRQLAGLVHPGWVTSTGTARLADVLRYLDAVGRRLDRLPADARRDGTRMAAMADVQARYDALVDRVVDGTASAAVRAGLAGVRWMLEELRVSLWAESLGTSGPVSPQRVSRALAALGG